MAYFLEGPEVWVSQVWDHGHVLHVSSDYCVTKPWRKVLNPRDASSVVRCADFSLACCQMECLNVSKCCKSVIWAQHAFQQLDRTLVLFVQGLISISIFFVILLVPRSNPMWKKPSASWFDAASKALCVWPLDGRPAYLGAVDSWEATKKNKFTWKLYCSWFVGVYRVYQGLFAINTRISGILEVWTVPKMMNAWPHETSVFFVIIFTKVDLGSKSPSFPQTWDNFLNRWGWLGGGMQRRSLDIFSI